MKFKVEKYIAKHKLFERKDSLLVALSGGADSVALLHVLLNLGYRCEAVHCNFHLRGEESNRDEAFVRALCNRMGVALHVVEFDTAGYAKEHGISIEMAAREQRYSAFEKLRQERSTAAIAVAHHKDDSAETLLLNLVRGTGIRGLRGIQPKNGYIVRPLLCVGREEIIDYLNYRGEDYVTDSTNLTCDYTRNKIRLEIIPKLSEINPSIKDSLASTAQMVSEAEMIYRKAIEEATGRVKNGNEINIALLKNEVAPITLLHEIISPYGFNGTQAENIIAALGGEGCRQFTANCYTIVKERDRLIITEQVSQPALETILPQSGKAETMLGSMYIQVRTFDGTISKEKNVATLDYDKLQMPLTLRSIRNGDRFAPYGMRGTKLVSDYLTDKKRTLIERQRQLVVCDASGKIVWLVDERPSSAGAVNESTKNIICLTWQKKE